MLPEVRVAAHSDMHHTRGMADERGAGAPVVWNESGDYTDIRYETTDDGIAIVTFDIPGEKMNTLSMKLAGEVRDLFEKIVRLYVCVCVCL